MKKTVARTPTGITGLDVMLGGGFPQGRVILVLGEPGAGKTILCSQFIANGINKFGENGLFVSLEENRNHYDREMNQFGWNFAASEKENKFAFVDASPIKNIPDEVKVGRLTIGKEDFSLISLLELVQNRAKSINAQRIVVDPVSLLLFQYTEEADCRKALLNLVEGLSETGATCLLASELKRVGLKGRLLQLEEYLVHGVVVMTSQDKTRIIQVEKMREASIDREAKPYTITESKGIEVHPTEKVI